MRGAQEDTSGKCVSGGRVAGTVAERIGYLEVLHAIA